MEISLEASGLAFDYGSQPVLRGVDFSLQSGSLTCLLGCNGAGKTTLLRCLLGLGRGYGGEIRVDGQDLRQYSPPALARCIAYIPQTVESVYEYSVEQFVLMGRAAYLGLFQSPTRQDRVLVQQKLELLGIQTLSNKSIGEISGGERQLAAIARALVQQSPILLMDEPTASLDYGNQLRFMQLARQLAEAGYLVLMSCHDPHKARRYAHQAMVLERGQVTALGGAQEVITPALLQRVYGVEEAVC